MAQRRKFPRIFTARCTALIHESSLRWRIVLNFLKIITLKLAYGLRCRVAKKHAASRGFLAT